MARRTKEEAEQTRQTLLDQALVMFGSQGLATTSLKSIAAAAGVTHGALYWHFRNRDDLLSALYHERQLPLDELYMDQLQAARQDGLAAIRQYLCNWVRLVVEQPSSRYSWQLFYQPGSGDGLEHLNVAIDETRTLWRTRLEKLIKKARKQKQLRARPKNKPDLLADNLFLLVSSLITASLSSPALCRDSEQADQIIGTYLKGVARS